MSNYQLMKLSSIKGKGSTKLIDSEYFYQKRFSNISNKNINSEVRDNSGSNVSQTYFNSSKYVEVHKKPKKKISDDDFFNN
jgi:hypothetical protein